MSLPSPNSFWIVTDAQTSQTKFHRVYLSQGVVVEAVVKRTFLYHKHTNKCTYAYMCVCVRLVAGSPMFVVLKEHQEEHSNSFGVHIRKAETPIFKSLQVLRVVWDFARCVRARARIKNTEKRSPRHEGRDRTNKHMAVGQNQWYHFGVGEFTTHFSLF